MAISREEEVAKLRAEAVGYAGYANSKGKGREPRAHRNTPFLTQICVLIDTFMFVP